MQITSDAIPSLLVKNIPRELVLAVEDALMVGARRAYNGARGKADGHLPHVIGQLRHFELNESFHQALTIAGAHPNPLLGNALISGRSGILAIGRFNVSTQHWTSAKRSSQRRSLAQANRAIEVLVQHGLFDESTVPVEGAVFFVAVFAGSVRVSPEAPLYISIAVPNPTMETWLFDEPLHLYLRRYEQNSASQPDAVQPVLKKNIKKPKTGGADNG